MRAWNELSTIGQRTPTDRLYPPSMPPRRSQQRRRDEARAQRAREDNLRYQPGPRRTYEESTYSFPMEDTPLTITVRSWNLDWIIQDFEADATWISTDGTQRPHRLAGLP